MLDINGWRSGKLVEALDEVVGIGAAGRPERLSP